MSYKDLVKKRAADAVYRAGHRKEQHIYYLRNREKALEGSRRQYRENPVKHAEWARRSSYKTRYGITIEDYDRMLEEQNGLCAICRRPPPGKHRLGIDHNHMTGQIRALLCKNCNRDVGVLEGPLRAALDAYILEYGA